MGGWLSGPRCSRNSNTESVGNAIAICTGTDSRSHGATRRSPTAASRRSIRRSVKLITIIVLAVMGGLAVFNDRYVEPYTTWEGQLVLVVVGLLFAAGLLWMRKLSQPQKLSRFLVVDRTARRRDMEAMLEDVRDGTSSRGQGR